MDFLSFIPARRNGKLRYMLMQSSYYNAPILVRTACDKQYLLELADIFGINIPEPIIIPPEPIKPPSSFEQYHWVKHILGKPLIQKDYFVSVYKLEEE